MVGGCFVHGKLGLWGGLPGVFGDFATTPPPRLHFCTTINQPTTNHPGGSAAPNKQQIPVPPGISSIFFLPLWGVGHNHTLHAGKTLLKWPKPGIILCARAYLDVTLPMRHHGFAKIVGFKHLLPVCLATLWLSTYMC